MPKRSFGIGVADTAGDYTMLVDKVRRKAERSHEENQERAYVAASRRTDRRIKARVQSARMASEIHKKRTGKGLRITKEIVMREEMYEEEDDDLPRSYRLLGPQLQTDSQELNKRVEALLTNKLATTQLLAGNSQQWRENEINKLFNQFFPNAQLQAQQLSQHLPGHYLMHHGAYPIHSLPESPITPNLHAVNYQPGTQHQDCGQSRPASSPTEFIHRNASHSPYIITPGFGLEAMGTGASLSSDGGMAPNTPTDLAPSPSAFTTELPREARTFFPNMGNEGDCPKPLYNPQDWLKAGMPYDASEIPEPLETESSQSLFPPIYYQDGVVQPPNLDPLNYSSASIEDNWNTFTDEAAWDNDQ